MAGAGADRRSVSPSINTNGETRLTHTMNRDNNSLFPQDPFDSTRYVYFRQHNPIATIPTYPSKMRVRLIYLVLVTLFSIGGQTHVIRLGEDEGKPPLPDVSFKREDAEKGPSPDKWFKA